MKRMLVAQMRMSQETIVRAILQDSDECILELEKFELLTSDEL